MRSLNLLFLSIGLDDADGEHPRGERWIVALRTAIASAGWTVDEPENWRDSGWSISCRRSGSEVSVVIGQAGEERDRWLVQISPARLPGWIARRLGGRASATPAQCAEIARIVHDLVQRTGSPHAMHWRVDGFPDLQDSPDPPDVSGQGVLDPRSDE